MGLYGYKGITPRLVDGCFIAPGAKVIGDVELGAQTSIWFNTVVRGDVNSIRVGARTNVQDNTTLHVTTEFFPLTIGDDVTIGHRAMVHGCTIGDNVLIGMGAVVLDGARIGSDSVVAAGALVVEGAEFPPRSVIMGAPAKRVREVGERDLERIRLGALSYVSLSADYLAGALAPVEAIDTDGGDA